MRARGVVAALCLAAPSWADGPDDARATAPLAAEILGAAETSLEASRAAVFPSQDAVGVSVSGEVPARFAAAVADALCASLSARNARCVALPAQDDDEAAARVARERGAQRVLRARLTREAAGIRVTVDALRARASAWDTFLRDDPAPVRYPGATLALRVDAALRARFGMPARPPWPASGVVRPRTIPTPFRDVVALAVGTLGAPASPALALATTDALRVARVEPRNLVFLPTVWALHPLGAAPSPPREPLGAMTWNAEGIRVRTSAQSQMGALARDGAGLSPTLRAMGDLWPVGTGAVRVDPATARVIGEGAAFSASWSGEIGTVSAVCDGAGGCAVRLGAETLATLREVSTPVVIDDLDEDGAPEVITASASAPDAPDRVRVFSLVGRALTERAGVATPGPVRAIATGEAAEGRVLVIAAQDLARGAATLMIVP